MESFFLAETTKYLYLLFDPDNFVNARGEEAVVVDVEGHGKCVVEAGQYYNMRFSTKKRMGENCKNLNMQAGTSSTRRPTRWTRRRWLAARPTPRYGHQQFSRKNFIFSTINVFLRGIS